MEKKKHNRTKLLPGLPVCQWSDDEPVGAAQKLVLINKAHVCDVDQHLV